jgi:hypothetical protein
VLTPGDTIRVKGEFVVHPLHQVDAMLRSFIEAAPAFDAQDTARELRKTLPIWDAMVGSGKAARVLFDLATAPAQIPRLIVPVKRSALQVELADVAGFCTMLAKVDRIVGPEDHVLALRLLHGAPLSDLERSTIEEAAVGMVEGFSEMGVPATREDVVMGGPLVMLRPLCIWR